MTVITSIDSLRESSKRIGNIGEAHTIAAFVDMKIPVYLPFGENESSDMIIDVDGYLYRVQVKTTSKGTKEKAIFSIAKNMGYIHENDKFKAFRKGYDLDEIDLLALYDITNDKLTLIEYFEVYGKRGLIVRYKDTKNGQKENIRYYKDYTVRKTINKLKNKHKALHKNNIIAI